MAGTVEILAQAVGHHRSGRLAQAELLDVFGRTCPEDVFFEIDRNAVIAYKARTERILMGMRECFARILGLEPPCG